MENNSLPMSSARKVDPSMSTMWLHLTMTVNIIFLVMNYFKPAFPIYLNMATTLVAILFYVLYFAGYRNHLRYFFFFFYIIWVSFYAVICDYSTGMIMYFNVLFALSILLFDNSSRRRIMALFPAAAFVIVIILKSEISPLVLYESPIRPILHFTLNFVLVFITIWKFVNQQEKESSDKDALISEINEKNSELERFAYITSHDLKQPVRNIVSFTGLLERNIINSNTKEKNLEYLDYIKKSSDSLDRLIDDILKMSKLDTSEFVDEVVDLNQVIDLVEDSMRQHIIDNKVSINRKNLPVIKGNQLFLNLLFQNLIENAIKYNENVEPRILITSYEFGDEKIIELKDNGIGIDKDFFDSVFQPFKRLHSNDSYSGSGLGLSICKKIMDIHKGSISIISSDSNGTNFRLVFPKAVVDRGTT